MYNQKEKIRKNIEAIKIAIRYEYGESMSMEDMKIVKSFSGWGSLKCVLYNPYKDEEWVNVSQQDIKLRPQLLELHNLLKSSLSADDYKMAIDSMRNSVLTSFYTPEPIVKTLYTTLKKYIYIDKYYDPSAGTGLFFTGTMGVINVNTATLYEKDYLTSIVLKAILSNSLVPVEIHNKPFEESSKEENEQYSLIASNIPFGSIPVYDNSIDKPLTSKVHNYFFAKGLSKLMNNGLLVYLVSDFFLNAPSNEVARKYLFKNSDFISCVCMPDNLMWESAGTMAPSHMIVVRKRDNKQELSQEEEWLCTSKVMTVAGKEVYQNEYIKRNPKCVIGKRVVGKNQYGKASIETVWDKSIEECADKFGEILEKDLQKRYTTIINGVHWRTAKKIGDVEKIEVEDNSAWIWENAATDIAIQESELSDIFKTKEEWEEEYNGPNRVVGVIREEDEESVTLSVTIETTENEQQILNRIKSLLVEPIKCIQPEGEPCLCQEKYGYIRDECKTQIKWPNTIPFKPGTIIEHESKLIQVQKVDNQNNITEYSEVEVKGKEGEILRDYISVRDEYIKQQK